MLFGLADEMDLKNIDIQDIKTDFIFYFVRNYDKNPEKMTDLINDPILKGSQAAKYNAMAKFNIDDPDLTRTLIVRKKITRY